MHWTGRILAWDPPRVFEYEWKIAPRDVLPQGEDTVVRWELTRDGSSTILSLVHKRLTKATALGFAPAPTRCSIASMPTSRTRHCRAGPPATTR